MGWFGRKSVEVHFIDISTGKSFAKSSVPLHTLPATFANAESVQTTVQIEGSDWVVVRAEPQSSDEFAKSKSLKLWVRAVQKVDPAKLLFSLPTICDYIPGVVPGKASRAEDMVQLHEDEWRQIELVSLALENQIDENISEIRLIYQNERVGVGFRRCHVRKEPREPFSGTNLTLTDLTSRLGPDRRSYGGLAYRGSSEMIEGGFALETGSLLTIYGLQKDSRITACCFFPSKGANGDADALLKLAKSYELCLVDWCRAAKVMPTEEEFHQYFRTQKE